MLNGEVVYEGQTYGSLIDLIQSKNKDVTLVQARLDRGLPLADALDDGGDIKVGSRGFNSMFDIAYEYGVDMEKLEEKVHKGFDIKTAIFELICAYGFVYRGKRYANFFELAEDYGHDGRIVSHRIDAGWSVVDAMMMWYEN